MTIALHNTFLSLVRIGIGTESPGGQTFPIETDWTALDALAFEQGLSAIVLDGIQSIGLKSEIPKTLRRDWLGAVLQDYEWRFPLYEKAIGEMAAFYNQHGFKMMVLKGYACSLDWPRPDHRPCGDIDIWQFGQYAAADAALAAEKGVEIDSSHHHHTVFSWGDNMVENHFDFINVYSRRSNRLLEATFKELGKDDSHSVDVMGQKVYLPSPNLHALFLVRHAVAHFTSTELNLRQVLDWAFFVKAHTRDIDWPWLVDILDLHHMKDFLGCLDAICVEELGFDAGLFPDIQFDSKLKERVFNDILSPEFSEEEPKSLIPRVFFKYRRWRANAWKHELCYTESQWSSFWSSVWAHFLKPSSI